MKKMKKLFTLLSFLLFWTGRVLASPMDSQIEINQSPYKFVPPRIAVDSRLKEERQLWSGASVQFNPTLPSLSGFSLMGGYQPGLLGVDFRVTYVKTSYGKISTSPDAGFVSSPSPGQEVSRPRDPSDSWSMLMFEPGLNWVGRIYTDILPLLSERARFGLGYGEFSDMANSIIFTGFVFSIEAALQYQLKSRSPWSIEVGVTYRNALIGYGENGSLPISMISTSISLLFWF